MRVVDDANGFTVYGSKSTSDYLNVIIGAPAEIAEFVTKRFKDLGLAAHLRQPRWQHLKLAYVLGLRVVTPGKGLGSKMLLKALGASKKRGAAAVFLHVLADVGHEADLRRFYESHGFRFASFGSTFFDEQLPVFWRRLS